MLATFGQMLAVGAVICGVGACAVLTLGLVYSAIFLRTDKKPGEVLAPGIFISAVTAVAALAVAVAGLPLVVIALLMGERTGWTWVGAAADGAFLLIFAAFNAIWRRQQKRRRQRAQSTEQS